MRGLKTGPPHTVLAFAALVVAVLVVVFVHDGADSRLLTGGPLLLLATFGLVRGFWPAWLFLAALAAGDLVAALFMWPAWWTVFLNGTMLALLLSPPSRRYARRGRPRLRGWLEKRGAN